MKVQLAEKSKTVDNALRLLLILGEVSSATALELSRMTGLSRPIVHRLLTTLHERGFVRREGSSYSIGFALLQLADGVEGDIRNAAEPGLNKLSSEFGQTSILAAIDGLQSVIMGQQVSQVSLNQVRYPIGFRSSLATGGHSIAILARSKEAVVDEIIRLCNSDSDRARLEKHLGQARRLGYAFTEDEVRSGTSGLAVPICGRHGFAVGSIGLVSPAGRFPDRDSVAAAARGVADDIEKALVR
ncbi:helix-turn-helix domain-containing protein [Nocardioides sp. AE5]|uniref:IclR family transcriptional regulator n=1 Tax=Nocardioides sp. AE5 TaxID=2962573 RepID=UPI002882659E|nr:helix-turn-helix domain-containing protein [Nocardioides sp. AE5]MDT0201843.1 helix-turn-helix domain-containing protein [Nocardioides sp. AE5]